MSEPPQNVTVQEGRDLVLRCRFVNFIGQVQWAKDGWMLGPTRDIPGYPRYEMVGDEDRGEFDLLIKSAILEDVGEYECQAKIKAVAVRASAYVEVLSKFNFLLILFSFAVKFISVPPKQIKLNGPKRVTAGDIASYTCETDKEVNPVEILEFIWNIPGDAEIIHNGTRSTANVFITKSMNGGEIKCEAKLRYPSDVSMIIKPPIDIVQLDVECKFRNRFLSVLLLILTFAF